MRGFDYTLVSIVSIRNTNFLNDEQHYLWWICQMEVGTNDACFSEGTTLLSWTSLEVVQAFIVPWGSHLLSEIFLLWLNCCKLLMLNGNYRNFKYTKLKPTQTTDLANIRNSNYRNSDRIPFAKEIKFQLFRNVIVWLPSVVSAFLIQLRFISVN